MKRRQITLKENISTFRSLTVVLFILLFLASAIVPVQAAENYEFERLWPKLKQRWYFGSSGGITFDGDDYVYMTDGHASRVLKFNRAGTLVRTIGRPGTGYGEFQFPAGVAVDSNGFLYVTDYGNDRIQKFDPDGKFVKSWGFRCKMINGGCFDIDGDGPLAPGDGLFYQPYGIAVDSADNVYVVEELNHRVQKFDSDGNFIAKWGSTNGIPGDGEGIFDSPSYIAVSRTGIVFVSDTNNNRVQKFDSDGGFISAWGTIFDTPTGIAVGDNDNVYISDKGNRKIRVFKTNGQHQWNFDFQDDLWGPNDIAVNKENDLYITEYAGLGVQKYTADGTLVTVWSSKCDVSFDRACIDPDGPGPLYQGDGFFYYPSGVAITESGNQDYIYVSDDRNHRIQKFKSDGTFVERIGKVDGNGKSIPGTGEGEFVNPSGIDVGFWPELTERLFVVDSGNDRVQVYVVDNDSWYNFEDGHLTSPADIAVYESGLSTSYAYVTDDAEGKIVKFNALNGEYLTEWFDTFTGPGNFPTDIAVDSTGKVYVIDLHNHRIKKFSETGGLLKQWGADPSYCRMYDGDGCVDPDGNGPLETGDGQFYFPDGIAIDSQDNVYVTDASTRIQKFNSDGEFIEKFRGPADIPVMTIYPQLRTLRFDSNDNLYIADRGNSRVLFFRKASKTALNKAIIVAGGGDYKGNRIWDATESNLNLAYRALTHQGISDDQIYYLSDNTLLDLDKDGIPDVDAAATNANLENAIKNWAKGTDHLTVYLADHGGTGSFMMNNEETLSAADLGSWLETLQTQTVPECSTAVLVDESFTGGLPSGWSVIDNASTGATWRFDDPKNRGNLTGGTGNFAIADSDHYGPGVNMDSELRTAARNMTGLSAVFLEFKSDFFYFSSGGSEVADVDVSVNGSAGPWTNVWRKTGADYRGPKTEVIDISSIAAGQGNVMVRFHFYNATYDWWWQVDEVYISGTVEAYIVNESFDSGQPSGWSVVDYAGTGKKWAFNDPGGRTNRTGGTGGFAIADSYNAGYGAMDTALLTSVLNMSNMSNVFLEFKTDFDYWAGGGSEVADVDVSVYYDGGGDSGYWGPWINVWRKTGTDYQGTETVDISSIAAGRGMVQIRFRYYNANYDNWWQVDDVVVRGTYPRCNRSVTVIYDACDSGSTLSALKSSSGKKRMIITSTAQNEKAKFAQQGTLSFSNYFWSNVLFGKNVKQSFDSAKTAVEQSLIAQTPQLDDNGNGVGNETGDGDVANGHSIGKGIDYRADMPQVSGGSVSPNPVDGSGGSHSADITVNASDNNEIESVRAVIVPPGYSLGAKNNAILDMPSIGLSLASGTAFNGTWTGSYDGFHLAGQYQVVVYAVDRDGDTSDPEVVPLQVNNPVKRKAIIVAGGDSSDTAIWGAVDKGVYAAYSALKYQGYSDSDIYFMSNEADPLKTTYDPALIDNPANATALSWAINTWASGASDSSITHDVVLYMIGRGSDEAFNIDNVAPLLSADLKLWIDNLQDGDSFIPDIQGEFTVIYDANESGGFLPVLAHPSAERILIASTGQYKSACYLSGGDISFSQYFWGQILNGVNVRDAYIHARDVMSEMCWFQTAQIDDNGNGTGNEKGDGSFAKGYTIGTGIRLAGIDPLVSNAGGDISITYPDTTATIWIDNTITTGSISKVWAIVLPPDYDPLLPDSQTDIDTCQLFDLGNNRYETDDMNYPCDVFTHFGRYTIKIYAQDTLNNNSLLQEMTVMRHGGADVYEDDDAPAQATFVDVNDGNTQQHNFDLANDRDWIMFYGKAGETYEVKATGLGSNSDVVLELYDAAGILTNPPSGMNPPGIVNAKTNGPDGDETLTFSCTQNGLYYVQIWHNAGAYGPNTEYDIGIDRPEGPSGVALLRGRVYDASVNPKTLFTSADNVKIKISGVEVGSINSDGIYTAAYTPGTVTVYFEKTGYKTHPEEVTFVASSTIFSDIDMITCMDGDDDGYGNPGDPTCSNGAATDCDDSNGAVHPGAPETWYDGIDQDCDGWNDYDQDKDGYVDISYTVNAGGTSPSTGDCIDTDPLINPATLWYSDTADGDTYGDETISVQQCSQPAGYVLDNTDNCPDVSNPAQTDGDGDGMGDACDGCPSYAPARIGGVYYQTIWDAYDAAGTGQTIQCQDIIYVGSFDMYRDIAVTIQGGYNCTYTDVTGITTIKGDMIILEGVNTLVDVEVVP